MDNTDITILKIIKETAQQVIGSGNRYLRADLAYDLRNHGIPEDSMEVGRLIYEAYRYFGNDDSIRRAFMTNDGRQSVVDSYEAVFECEENPAEAIQLIKRHLGTGQKALSSIEAEIDNAVGSNTTTKSGIMSAITGTAGVQNVKASAEKAFARYTEMISGYETAKTDVKMSMTDFVFLREKVRDMFNTFSSTLVDIFGDSIKVVDSELFDFNDVEWLDVKGMLEAVKLDYDTITSTCSTLVGEITDDFSSSLRNSASLYRDSSGNKKIGLALAALNLFGHYADAGQKTAAMQQDLVRLTDKMKKDSVTIKGDIGRLHLIYRTLTELYIPKSETFFKHAGQVFTSEFEALVSSIYSSPESKALKEEKDSVLSEYKNVQKRLIDEQLNMDIYASSIEHNRELLDLNRKNYDEAKSARPDKPFFLINLLTLGSAKKRYDRDLTEWYEMYGDAVNYYENIQTDIEADNREYKKISAALAEDERQMKSLRTQMNGIAAKMRNIVNVPDEVKANAAERLTDIVTLLKIAKDIISSGLDEQYMKTVKPSEYNSISLAPDTERNLKMFSDSLKANLEVCPEYFHTQYKADNGEIIVDGLSEADSRTLSAGINETVGKTVALFEEYARLAELKRQSALADEEYKKHLEILQKEFMKEMDSITDKGDVLRESLRRINLASSEEELKEGLKSLSCGKIDITESDIEEFIDGHKNLTI